MSIWLDDLNEQQRLAVTAPLGNTLVLAGAGSGKTRVLVSRIAWLIEHESISSHEILAVTFTNKAAGEMKSRLSQLLSCPTQGLWVGTFHGLCHRILRRHYKEAHLPEHFHILDSDDQVRILKRVMNTLNLDLEQWPVKQAQHFINNNKDEGLRPEHVHVSSHGPGRTLVRIYKAYEQACQASGVIDFAELILRCYELLRDNLALLSHYQHQFRAILVDEFQDTNTIQYAWIRLLATLQTSVMAVGDDDQSIYGWRGAKIENIKRFTREFKDTIVIRLEQNYRSTAIILEAANTLIAKNDSRMGKNLWTAGQSGEKIILFSAFNEVEEARFISERIAKEIRNGKSANDIAVLYRSNAQSRLIEESLIHVGITYRIYGGVRFFERAEVKDVLAYLRLIANPHDDASFERVVNFPTRGIGGATLDQVRIFAKDSQCSLWNAAQQILSCNQLSQRAANALSKFIAIIEQFQEHSLDESLDAQIREIIQKSGLQEHYSKEKGEKAQARLDNMQELVNAAKQFRYEQDDEQTLPITVAFLSHASLESGEMQGGEHESCVHLMTLHAAKGLEFPIVFIAGMEEGVFPSKQATVDPGRLEEERRLCYVGMTRAMEKLVISYAEIRRLYGREEYHRPSRFLGELPENLLEAIRPKAHYQMPTKTNVYTQSIEDSGFKLGQVVQHSKFGQGTVMSLEGSGANTRIQVNFPEYGTKWLVLAYANLT